MYKNDCIPTPISCYGSKNKTTVFQHPQDFVAAQPQDFVARRGNALPHVGYN
jgi:hypothetical protein